MLVDKLLVELGLEACSDVYIGGALLKGERHDVDLPSSICDTFSRLVSCPLLPPLLVSARFLPSLGHFLLSVLPSTAFAARFLPSFNLPQYASSAFHG
jgi:hypothetical protein